MTRYVHGVHDPGGEHLMDGRPGWVLVTEEVGLNPQAPGRDYTHISNRGIGVIVRLNHGYGSTGTIPLPDKYPQFAAACASWAARSQGVAYYIIGNEPNGEWERPNGVAIKAVGYARCFILCSEAIKRAVPGAKVMHAAIAPYHASPTLWHLYLREVLQIIAPTGLCDALDFHTYARSMNPAELLSEATMDAPLQGKYYGFLTILDAIAEVPGAMLGLPAFITEFDVYPGWENRNTGIITAMYEWVHGWNSNAENLPKIAGALNFRWLGPPDAENVHDWEMRNKPELLQDFRAAVAKGYPSPQADDYAPQKNDEKLTREESAQVFLPVVSTSDNPALPPREWDERLTQRGVTIDTPLLQPGDVFWRVVKARWFDKAEAGGRHHIYVEAITPDGRSVAGVPFMAVWPDDSKVEYTKAGRGFEAGNYPMSASLNEFSVQIADGVPSEVVTGIGMGADGNPREHTATLVTYQLAAMPAASQPQPQPSRPATVPALAHPVADPRYRTVTQPYGPSTIDYSIYKVDGVPLRGHNGLDFGTPMGTMIAAVDSGVVAEVADEGNYGYGKYIKLVHEWGETVYAHLYGQFVQVGQRVDKGESIALSGSSGHSTGPHLHFGLRVKPFNRADGWGGFTDPAPYLVNAVAPGPFIPTQPQEPQTPQPPARASYLPWFRQYGEQYAVPWYLLAALAYTESKYEPGAVSHKDAQGMMQFVPTTWADMQTQLGVSDPFDPEQGIWAAAYYLAQIRMYLMRFGKGTPQWMVAGYNWGPGNVAQAATWETVPAETRRYVDLTLEASELLRRWEDNW